MSFTQLFSKYNFILNPLCGSVIQCLIKKCTTKHGIGGYRTENCNNLFPT
jgi:hypothetical protein